MEPQLARILRATREVLPLAALAVRDDRGRLVASSPDAVEQRPVPEDILEPDRLMPATSSAIGFSRRDLPLPAGGGRIALLSGNRAVGWLDVWGNGAGAGAESRRAVSDVARLVGLFLASHP
jgi:hypothetical protein